MAIPISLDGSASPVGAINVSAVRFRTPLSALVEAVPNIRQMIIERLGTTALR